MEYFYTPPHLIGKNELTIEGDEFAHLTHVMRKKPGDAIRVVNGAGTAYDVTIVDGSRHTARCMITAAHRHLHEPEVDLTIGVAILKNSSRFDVLVEKVTELGANTLVPLVTERTIPRHAKTERWKKLALAAMKQSERCVLPEIKELTGFRDFVGNMPRETTGFIPHEKASGPHLAEALGHHDTTHVMLAIGPEGGFTDEEVEQAVQSGFIPVTLGPRRLRTETAAVVAASLALCRAS